MAMRIIVAGDFLPKNRIQKLIDAQDYSMMDEICLPVQNADYSIVNLECPIVEDGVMPIEKGGPNHKTTKRAIEAIQYAGFDCVTLANNHFRDFGDEGCITTIDSLNSYGIDYVGGGRNLHEAQKVLYKHIGNKILSIVNICENEFSIATATAAGSATLDPIDNYNQIIEARNNSDFVLVIVHGGHEHYQLPSPRMKKLYRHFISLGADAVVNHHQHCYSGYEFYNGHPIVYGLGNLCFDSTIKRARGWYEGYMVELNFDTEIRLTLYPYNQCKAEARIELIRDDALEMFDREISNINAIISDDIQLNSEFCKFAKSKERNIKLLFGSYHNRYLNGAARRGFLPILLTDKEMKKNGSYVKCESHLEILQHIVFKDSEVL